MAKIGIFFGSDTGNTRRIAKMIADKLGDAAAKPVNVNKCSAEDWLQYDSLIIGSPTYGDGELPGLSAGLENESWEEFLPKLEGADLSGKTIAIFGLGDQVSYADNFVDAMGFIYDVVTDCGAKVVGAWDTDGYEFNASKGVLDDGKFIGLVLDQDNQKELSEMRVDSWLEEIKPALLG